VGKAMPSAPSLSHHHFLVGAMFKPFLVMGGKNGLVLPTSNFQLFLPGRKIEKLKNRKIEIWAFLEPQSQVCHSALLA